MGRKMCRDILQIFLHKKHKELNKIYLIRWKNLFKIESHAPLVWHKYKKYIKEGNVTLVR